MGGSRSVGGRSRKNRSTSVRGCAVIWDVPGVERGGVFHPANHQHRFVIQQHRWVRPASLRQRADRYPDVSSWITLSTRIPAPAAPRGSPNRTIRRCTSHRSGPRPRVPRTLLASSNTTVVWSAPGMVSGAIGMRLESLPAELSSKRSVLTKLNPKTPVATTAMKIVPITVSVNFTMVDRSVSIDVRRWWTL